MSAITALSGVVAGSNASFLNNPGTQSYSHITFGGTCSNGIRVANDGKVYELDNGTATERATWLLSGGTASDYEVQYTVNSGTIDAGTTGSYLALSTFRDAAIQTELVETDTANLTVTIRHATRTTDSISFTATLSATEDTI